MSAQLGAVAVLEIDRNSSHDGAGRSVAAPLEAPQWEPAWLDSEDGRGVGHETRVAGGRNLHRVQAGNPHIAEAQGRTKP